MKKMTVLFLLCVFFMGCSAAARNSEFYEHKSMYKNWNHLWYSWTGYKKDKPEDVRKALEEEWWGVPVPSADTCPETKN